jgi:dienelactone hydrolase
MLKPMPRAAFAAVWLVLALAGCATAGSSAYPGQVEFPNVTPAAPRTIPAVELRPDGAGPFPAVVLLHGCHGVSASTRDWARWFRERGYVALVVDSWAARGMREGCTPSAPEVPNTERFDDAIGALRYLQARSFVDRERIGVIGWSNGGVFSIAVINGPSHERALKRGVVVPPPGYRAAVGVYPGGCFSLVHELVARPLLVLMGDADDWTLPGPCVEMVDRMRARGADATIVLYPGAVHYFDVEGQPRVRLTDVENRNLPGGCCGATVGYDPAAAVDARRRVAAFFDYHLEAR